jgi:hypothetical protein
MNPRDQAKEWLIEHLQAAIDQRLDEVKDADFLILLRDSAPTEQQTRLAAQAAADALVER